MVSHFCFSAKRISFIIRHLIIFASYWASVRVSLIALLAIIFSSVLTEAEEYNAVKLIESNTPCEMASPGFAAPARPCSERDAILFVHGIYGDKGTFQNGDFNWPAELAKALDDKVDIYVVEYRTKLFSWLKRDIASFDDVSGAFFAKLQGELTRDGGRARDGLLSFRAYRSVNFIAHSLGGNITAAYIHTVKSRLGHEERAQNGFLITLGTPANGAQIANVGVAIKSMLGMRDPLLRSLERDNTFVNMLASWRNAEDAKASRFDCRPVNLYVGVEGSRMSGMTIVSKESAEEPYKYLAREVKFFDAYDHSRIAKPTSTDDPVYVWVLKIINDEQQRLNEWKRSNLCQKIF